MDRVEEIIMLCANDEQCPVSDVISEISSELGIEMLAAAEAFMSKSDFFKTHDKLVVERSDEFWVNLEPVQKDTFFTLVNSEHLAKRGIPPFFYISIID